MVVCCCIVVVGTGGQLERSFFLGGAAPPSSDSSLVEASMVGPAWDLSSEKTKFFKNTTDYLIGAGDQPG